jgi:hypothetical protein
MKKIFLMTVLILISSISFAANVGVTIDYNTVLHDYERDKAFGSNALGEWTDYSLYKTNAYRFQQAGTRFLRFPGGSNSNEYHWNGNGSYDANKIWNNNSSPLVTSFSRGFYNLSIHRGSLSKGYGKWAFVTDGDLNTNWLSYPDDDGPQWIYLDIETASYQPVAVNRIVIDWGDQYAAQYKVQYSNGNWNGLGQWIYNDTAWTDVIPGPITGTGGTSDLSFTTVNAKYIRVLCLTPSAAHNQFSIKEIKLYNSATLLTKNEADVNQTPSVSSSVALGDKFQEYDTMDFEEFISFCKTLTPTAEPMITINFYTGTTQEAADWVYYANKYQGYNVKFWEIGNENAGNWEAGGPSGPESYAKRYIAMYDAMINVDPSIVIAPQFNSIGDPANVTMTSGNNAGASDHYIDLFLKYLADNGRSGILKGLSVHRYPTFMPANEAATLAQVDLWNTDLPLLKSWINNRCSNPSQVKTWLSEYNDGIDSGFTNHFSNSLFVSAYVLNYLKNGGDYSFFFRPFGIPGPGQTDLTIYSDFGYLEGGGLSGALVDKRFQPRSSFYAFSMLYNNFSAADSFGNSIIAASSGNTALKVYANKRGDRKLSIMFVNTDSSNTMTANISISGFTPLPNAELISYAPRNYVWINNLSQSYASPDNPPDASILAGAANTFNFDVEPYSVKIITMYDSSQATLVPSSTPTMLPTSTITPTPVPNGGVMLDDCNDGNVYDLWNGTWSTYGDSASSFPTTFTSMTCDSNGIAGNGCYMQVTGSVATASWGFGVNCPLNSSWASTDISQYDGLFFSYKGDGSNARVAFIQMDMADSNYGIDFSGTTNWAFYAIPFSSLTHSSFGSAAGTWTATNIRAVQVQCGGGYPAGYREISMDNIGFYKNTATFTKTATFTATRTATATITWTRTAGSTPVNTATATPSATLTATPVKTAEKNLDALYVSPAPFNAANGDRKLCFYNLTSHFILKLYNVKGEEVFEKEADSVNGTYCVDLYGQRMRQRLASGVYVYFIDAGNGMNITGKLAVIR